MRSRTTQLILAAVVTSTIAAVPVATSRVAATDRVVVVRPGQTLSEIALANGLSVAQLARDNDIADANRIYAGQRLRVRDPQGGSAGAASGTATGRRTAPRRHTVAAGESLWSIALRYRTTVTAIARANAIGDPSFIRVGQVLAIPGAAAAGGARRAGAAGLIPPGMPPRMAAAVARHRAVGRLIADEASRQGVPVGFALAVAWQESGWQQNVVSPAGAIGVMQLLPSTADWVAQTMVGGPVNAWDPASNVRAGVRLLRHYLDRYGGSRTMALAAYYQGQAAADRYGVYASTWPYVSSILALERIFAR